MEDDYEGSLSKLALAATSAQLAKVVTVQEFGVGEDLCFNFMGWNEEDLVIVCQIRRDLMLLDPELRLEKCAQLCRALRRFWGITAITMIAEGYCSLDAKKTKGVELAKDFCKPDSAVEECITITHAEIIENTIIDINLIALPYVYELGRTVNWLEMLSYPSRAEQVLRNAGYPRMLEDCLRSGLATEEVPPEAYDELRAAIASSGFHIQEF
jgi:hypothetical protein